MRENINILLYSDIGHYLDGEDVDFLVCQNDETFLVKNLPITLNRYMSSIKPYFAYDYDKLSDVYKNFYQDKYKSLTLQPDKSYKLKTKSYTFKKNNLK